MPRRDGVRRAGSDVAGEPVAHELEADAERPVRIKTLTSAGVFMLNKIFYNVGARHGFEQVLVITDGNQPGDKITVTDLRGEIPIEHTRPAPGITYVGNGRPRGPRQGR